MTMSDDARDPHQDVDPAEIEALLPWYAAGTLNRRDRRRVEAALRNDPALIRQAELVREELAETIRLNEMLGAPSPRVMDRLMTAIDAEGVGPHKRHSLRAVARWFSNVIASFSPRTLGFAASIAAIAIAAEAFALIDMIARPQAGVATAELGMQHGPFAMVRFTRQANAAEITNFLQDYQATVVDGPTPAGLYRVKIGMASRAKEELGRIVMRMRQEKIIEFAEESDETVPSAPQ